jgi:hypothetical protein
VSRPRIDPAFGLNLDPRRTLTPPDVALVSVVVPAHNEQATVGEVVGAALDGLRALGVDAELIVAASACTDDTAGVAAAAGARVVATGAGKGTAVAAGLAAARGDVICLVDGDLRYFGVPPLAAVLTAPILDGRADATIADLYWRPIYPQLWLYGFFAPLAGRLFPELLPKVGTTAWSGQRAARRELWPTDLPADFTVDLTLLLHWNDLGVRLRPVLADDWTNPQRPKPDLMFAECALLLDRAVRRERLPASAVPAVTEWMADVYERMARYRPGRDDPLAFDADLLAYSIAELDRRLTRPFRAS